MAFSETNVEIGSAESCRLDRDEASKVRLRSAANVLLPHALPPEGSLFSFGTLVLFHETSVLTLVAHRCPFVSSVFVVRPIDRRPVLSALPFRWVGTGGGGDDGGAGDRDDAGGGGDGGGDGGCGGDNDEAILVGWGRSRPRHAVGGGLHVRVSFLLASSLRLTPTARQQKQHIGKNLPHPLAVEISFAVRRLVVEGQRYWYSWTMWSLSST